MVLSLDIKVIPSSGRNKFIINKSNTLKCFLKSPPEGGKANKELIRLISKALGVPKDAITIALGATSRTKRIKIDTDISYEEALGKLGVERQLKIG